MRDKYICCCWDARGFWRSGVGNDAAYAWMTNIYATAGMQEDVGNFEVMEVKNVLLARGIYSIYDDTAI